MCELEKDLLRAARSITDEQISERMNAYLNQRSVTGDMVQKYISGKSGVPLKYIGAFIAAMGIKPVCDDALIVDPEEFNAYKVLARKQINEG